VSNLPANAIVFTEWNTLYPLYYVAHIEQFRPDLTFIETKPRSDSRGLAASVVEYVKANLNNHPIFFSDYRPNSQKPGTH